MDNWWSDVLFPQEAALRTVSVQTIWNKPEAFLKLYVWVSFIIHFILFFVWILYFSPKSPSPCFTKCSCEWCYSLYQQQSKTFTINIVFGWKYFLFSVSAVAALRHVVSVHFIFLEFISTALSNNIRSVPQWLLIFHSKSNQSLTVLRTSHP